MAIDRNKVAQQAERLVAQGKVGEAIAQYEILVKDNPRDMNTINKIGDLYSRLGKKREAILQFIKIGEFYAKDGFFLKAIAIYKKIGKLDPSHLDAYQRLADLYAQQGLVLEARSQYLMVAEQYLKAADVGKAISAYKALVHLDPDNLKHRGHLADLLAKSGQGSEAAEEYTRLGAELERKGHEKEARSMYQKGASIQPGSPAVVARLATAQVASGDIEGGIKIVKDALKKPGSHKDLLAILGDFHLKAGQLKEAESAYRRAIEESPERADLNLRLARALIDKGDGAGAYDALAPHLSALGKEAQVNEAVALLERIPKIDAGHVESYMRLSELYAVHKKESDFTRCAHAVLDLCIGQGEYAAGKRYAAALLKLRPSHEPLREKLRMIQSKEKAPSEAPASSASKAAPITVPKVPRTEQGSDAGSLEVQPLAPAGSLSTPSADLSASIDLPAALNLEPEDEDFITEHMTEADVFVKYGLSDRAIEQLVSVVERFPAYVAALEKLKEIYLEEGNREAARQQMAMVVKAHLAAGDNAQAEAMLTELRRFDPHSRESIELMTAMFPGSAASSSPVMAQAVMGPDVEMEDDPVLLDDGSIDGEEAVVVEEETDERAPTREELKEVDVYLGRGSREEAVSVLRRLALECGSHPEIVSRMKAAMALQAGPSRELVVQPPGAAPEEVEESVEESDLRPNATLQTADEGSEASSAATDSLTDLSDLASEIDAALMGDTGRDEALLAGVEATPEGHSLEEIVQAFKKGIEQQVGAEDFDTHYNLGIAYKEMGLMDEAIGEFQFAAKDARLLVDCCSMLGICFREKGMSTLAVKWYRRGLDASASRDEETMLGLRYDLAELLAEMGEQRQAMDLFTEVFGINSKYRDVAARIKELERQRP